MLIITRTIIDILMSILGRALRRQPGVGSPQPQETKQKPRNTEQKQLNINIAIYVYIYIYIYIHIFTIIISISSSTQRSARRPVDEVHVFQKKVFSPRPEATFQVNFNANTHLFLNLKCNKQTKNAVAQARCTFLSLLLYYTND